VRADASMAVVPWWIETHCVVPDGFRAGEPFRLYDDQLLYLAAFYLVRGDVDFDPVNPILAPAFRYRRGMYVGPQKVGKSPFSAAHICLEGAGPSVFAGWAIAGDVYRCVDHGCGCGAEYAYEPGEPMGIHRPTPNIQIIAVSEDQTDNVYRALRRMIEKGPLRFVMSKTGEDFIRLPDDGLVEPVTSSALSRVGNPVTFVIETEVGLYTKRNKMRDVSDALHRNLAGMSARASLETNAWDPAQASTAQIEAELVEKGKVDDVYVQFRHPPKNLSFTNKVERRRILRHVYPADTLREAGGHVDLDSIDAEAAGMVETDAAQAARFFGNILVKGSGAAFDIDAWRSRRVTRPHEVPKGALVVLGFDGSRRRDHTSLIGTEVASGYQWPLGIWRASDYRGGIPGDIVDAVVEQAFDDFDVWRLYADPPYWEDTIAGWIGRFGKERVHEWWTNRIKTMAYALRSFAEAITTGALSHCPEEHALCPLFTEHVGNAIRRETGFRDDGGDLWGVEKPSETEKIDSVPAAVLSWEARNDAMAAGVLNVESFVSVYETRGLIELGAS
jgi:hypothetical protein